jgi:hypothetical protein
MDKQGVRAHNIRMAMFLCDKHGCDEKLRKKHFEQMVRHAWNPHPSSEFCEWWHRQPECAEGVDAERARNCKVYVNRYKEAVEFGNAAMPVDYPT